MTPQMTRERFKLTENIPATQHATVAVVLQNEALKIKVNGEAVVSFDVTFLINETPFFTMHGWELFRGFIDPPTMRKKSEAGVMWEKMVDRAAPFIDLIYRAIMSSDWLEKWPEVTEPSEAPQKPSRPDPSLKLVKARAGMPV